MLLFLVLLGVSVVVGVALLVFVFASKGHLDFLFQNEKKYLEKIARFRYFN